MGLGGNSRTGSAQRKTSCASDWLLLFLFYSVTVVAVLPPTAASDLLLIALVFTIAVTATSTSFQFLRGSAYNDNLSM